VRDQGRHTPERRLLVGEHAPCLLRRGRAAGGAAGEDADDDRHGQEETQHEHGRRVEHAQGREKIPVERQDAHDPDRERVGDPAEVGDGHNDQDEEQAQQRSGHMRSRGRAQQRCEEEGGGAHDEGQDDLDLEPSAIPTRPGGPHATPP